MIRNKLRLPYILYFILTACPLAAEASTCQTITNGINNDILKYGDNLNNQRLPWMQLSWLQQYLGAGTTTNLYNEKTQYEWHCDNQQGFLIVDADKNGNLLSVTGEFSSEDGGGLFTTQLSPLKSQQEFDQMLSSLASENSQYIDNNQIAPPNQLVTIPETPELKCKNLISQIRADLSTYAGTIQTKELPWMSVPWLLQKLGEPQVSFVYDNVYKWSHYTLFIGADGSRAEFGSLPKGMHPQTYIEASEIFGAPLKTHTEKLTVNTWQCQGNNNSNLTIITGGDKKIVSSVMGKDCIDERCSLFSVPLSGSILKHKFEQDIRKQADAITAAIASRIKNYNTTYGTSLHTQEELTADMNEKIKNYYTNLRECHAGIYQYALPVLHDFLYNTAVINSQKNGKCSVKTSYQIPEIGKVELKCNYELESLRLFTDAEAVAALNNATLANNQNSSEIQKVIERDCKRYIDGVL